MITTTAVLRQVIYLISGRYVAMDHHGVDGSGRTGPPSAAFASAAEDDFSSLPLSLSCWSRDLIMNWPVDGVRAVIGFYWKTPTALTGLFFICPFPGPVRP